MLVNPLDIHYQRERYQALLKEAEQARLVNQLRADSPKPSLWQRLRHRLSSLDRTPTLPAPDVTALATCLTEPSEYANAH
jgi:hypothetical protein